MADFSCYGTIYNQTYYVLPTPSLTTPVHGYWKIKPKEISLGGDTSYRIADHAGCYGSQASFFNGSLYDPDSQMSYEWSVACPYHDNNYVHPKSLSKAVVTNYEAKSGDSNWLPNSVQKGGHPVHVKHYVRHNPEYLLPYGTQQKQKMSYWCWAACTSMLISYFRFSGDDSQVSQCNFVSKFLNGTKCCDSSTPTQLCNKPSTVAMVMEYLSWYSIQTKLTNGRPSFVSLELAFDNMQPLVGLVKWGGMVGHMILFHGYIEDSSNNIIRAYDPEYGNVEGPYTTMMTKYQKYGTIVGCIFASLPHPWTDDADLNSKLEKNKPTMQADYKECIEDRIDLLVTYLAPTLGDLNNPNSAKRGYAQLQVFKHYNSEAIDIQKLILFEDNSNEIALTYDDATFVSDLRNTVLHAKKFADGCDELHEIVYAPLPFLRVDAVVVFHTKTQQLKSVFVVPKLHETEFAEAVPHDPAVFLKSMKERFAEIEKLDEGDEEVWR